MVKSLALAGVDRIFSLSGNQIMPVFDACLSEGIRIIHTRHEAAAVYMAEAHAQLTGRIGVALVTAGAGAANALGPLVTTAASETPVLLLTGDSPVGQDGQGAFQEMQQVPMTAPLTKLSLRPETTADLGQAVAQAVQTAESGRPGPVHIALPFDVVQASAAPDDMPENAAFQRLEQPGDIADLEKLARAVAAAERPVVLTGPVLNATRAPGATALAQALGAPVINMESPRGLRDPALGDLAGVLAQADLIVAFGKCVDFTLGFGAAEHFDTGARWIVLHTSTDERDRAARNLGNRLAQMIAADPRDAAAALIAHGTPSETSPWAREVARGWRVGRVV